MVVRIFKKGVTSVPFHCYPRTNNGLGGVFTRHTGYRTLLSRLVGNPNMMLGDLGINTLLGGSPHWALPSINRIQ